jgi:hypothetical protein
MSWNFNCIYHCIGNIRVTIFMTCLCLAWSTTSHILILSILNSYQFWYYLFLACVYIFFYLYCFYIDFSYLFTSYLPFTVILSHLLERYQMVLLSHTYTGIHYTKHTTIQILPSENKPVSEQLPNNYYCKHLMLNN